MTIKPVVAPNQKRVQNDSDGKKESHTHGSHSGQVGVVVEANTQQNVVVRNASQHPHRNVVIDTHGQSPQRRVEVYDDIARHRRSPHKSTRSKRRDHHDHHHHKRVDRVVDREKLTNITTGVANKCNSPHGVHGGGGTTSVISNAGNSPANINVGGTGGVGGKSPEHLNGLPVVLGCPSPKSQAAVTQAAGNILKAVEETFSGYNSGDEHLQPKEATITADEWQQRDEQFAKCMTERGYILKPVEEDGACLFRSISLQIYGDEEMHDVIRQHTMDYIYKNREYFGHFVTEDINSYIKRKRRKDSHGNHIEIQAMSEIYSRPVEVYCYKPTPINIFNSEQLNNGYAPLRLSYQRGSHYNAIIDPYNATVGVGLGLAGYKPELQTKEAARLNEQLEIEQTMFEDKLKTTDWEATNEAIEEQIARESYLQWCRENLQKSRAVATSTSAASSSATVTSAEFVASDAEASPSKYSMTQQRVSSTITASTPTLTSASSSVCNSNNPGNSGSNCMPPTKAALATLEQNFALASKSLMHNVKKDTNVTNSPTNACDVGFESDDTDMSSTSSIGNTNNAVAGNASPSSAVRGVKKTKTRGCALRNSKKRRREYHAATVMGKSDVVQETEASARKSPKLDSCLKDARAQTPDAEQRPCTSKQSSSTPEKQSSTTLSIASTSKTSVATAATNQPLSNFYQELLEASYATDGYGQLTESEMLQRAIQMSTQDYIQDQKRKYLYGP